MYGSGTTHSVVQNLFQKHLNAFYVSVRRVLYSGIGTSNVWLGRFLNAQYCPKNIMFLNIPLTNITNGYNLELLNSIIHESIVDPNKIHQL